MSAVQAVRIRLIAIIAVLLAQISMAGESNPTQSLVEGETAFALDLYGRLKSQEGNLFFSPYSISTCLGMTYTGARGNTARQMAKTLHFNVGPTELPMPMGALEQQLNDVRKEKGFELNTANGLWAQQGHPFLPSFIQTAQQQFDAVVKQANFRTEAEPVRKEINEWVGQQTKGKITNLLPPSSVNPMTRLILVNAIYFKGRWVLPFKESATAEAPFDLGNGQNVQANLMSQEASFKYGENDDLQWLELPYTSGESAKAAPGQTPSVPPLSMVVLLPRKVDGLKKLENSLSPSELNQWISQVQYQKVRVFLPKFKLTAEFSLGGTLAGMGMTDAFSRQADFSGMDGTRDLFISAVVHKAYVDVNEEGTEAAAATGVAISRSAVKRPKPVPVFRADHPFLFLIRDTGSGSILFLGRVNDPSK